MGASLATGFSRAGCGAGAGFDEGWGTGCDGANCSRGALGTGASLAVSTSGVCAGGAGASRREKPSNTSACNAIEASTHQSKTRSSRSG